jgi:serine protease AprX
MITALVISSIIPIMKRNKIILRSLLPFILLLFYASSGAQNYWVFLKDKAGVVFDPYEYFDTHTIERRLRAGYPIDCVTDYPVNAHYLSEIGLYADSLGYASRWFNAVAVSAGDEAIRIIAALPFVSGIEKSTASRPMEYATADYDTILQKEQRNLMQSQVSVLGLEQWRKAGIDGTGIRIAVFDGGFPSWPTNPAFTHLVEGERILQTWDFTRNRENVDRGISHGTLVLSCIGGMIDGKPMGLATGASYLLAITEIRREPFKEEQFWLAAAEWSDKHGADVINSSLGYVQDRYHNIQMDGRTTFVTKAANKAASKGILVVNSAGNSGSGRWKVIGAPADADSVLAIGGISPYTGYHTSFSSFGPTSDNRLKPNVTAFAHVVAAGKKRLQNTQGTSFSSPLVAGFAACAWQSDRSLNNMELFRKIEQSGHLYPFYDYAHGYGIPQAGFFLDSNYKEMRTNNTFTMEIGVIGELWIKPHDLSTFIPVTNEAWSGDPVYLSEDNDYIPPAPDVTTDNYIYLHVRDASGVLRYYRILEITADFRTYETDSHFIKQGETVCVHFRGYTKCLTFEEPGIE